MAKLIEAIYTEDRRGLGTKNDPVRLVPQWWTKEGELLFEKDGWAERARAEFEKGGE